MADPVETALASVAEGLDQPSWADMLTQAEELTVKGKIPPPASEGSPVGKHVMEKKGGGGKKKGKAPKAEPKQGEKGQPSTLPKPTSPKGGEKPLQGPKRQSLSSQLSQSLDTDAPVPPGLPSEFEDDLETLSQVASVHESRLSDLQNEVVEAKAKIEELEKDQQKIMTDFSSLRHELVKLKALLGTGIQTPVGGGAPSKGSVIGARGKEVVQAPPSKGEASSSSGVAQVPAWKKKRV